MVDKVLVISRGVPVIDLVLVVFGQIDAEVYSEPDESKLGGGRKDGDNQEDDAVGNELIAYRQQAGGAAQQREDKVALFRTDFKGGTEYRVNGGNIDCLQAAHQQGQDK
jgi:hypothetical protein